MQRQKLSIRSPKIIVLLFFVLTLVGAQWTYNQDSPAIEKKPLLAAKPIESSSPSPVIENKVYQIVIDPGHGGKDPGANGASGKEEKDYTLSLALQIYDLLEQETMFEPFLTRDDDTFIPLDDRAKIANDLEGDALISIHGNTYSEDPRVIGTETYYYTEESSRLAQVVHDHLLNSMGFKDRDVRKENWKVLTESKVPAILAEIGFLTNQNEEAAMISKYGQANAARAIVDALKQYFTES